MLESSLEVAPADRADTPLTLEARVTEALPSGLFRVEPAGGARAPVIAHVAGGASLLRVRPGDRVLVELMAYDPGRGRITKKIE